MMELIKISNLTSQLNISSRTLRYYEQVGLIQSVRLQFDKYRFYDIENIEKIKQIVILRKMQIPVKDIISIYKSKNLTILVDSFVKRIKVIENEIDALNGMKLIVNKFIQAMIENGIKHISALPLLYEKIEKKLGTQEICKTENEFTYKKLSDLSEQLSVPLDLIIIDLPPMRVLSSKRKGSDTSDVEGFWDWLGKNRIPFGTPGSHQLFEYQEDNAQTVIIQNIDRAFNNNGPYLDYEFEGGLFAVGNVFVDDDIPSFHRRMVKSFDDNPYYEVDYRHGGALRHDSFVESVISPDGMRERMELFLPVKKRLSGAQQDDRGEQISNILNSGFNEQISMFENSMPLVV